MRPIPRTDLQSEQQHVSDYFDRSHRLARPRTVPSQGINTGSNPVGTTNTYAIRDFPGLDQGYRDEKVRALSADVISIAAQFFLKACF
jgi:hypothetical protein